MVSRLCRGGNDRRNREFVIGDLPHSPDTRKDGPNSAPAAGAVFGSEPISTTPLERNMIARRRWFSHQGPEIPQPEYVEGHRQRFNEMAAALLGMRWPGYSAEFA